MPRRPLVSENARPIRIIRQAVVQRLAVGHVHPGELAVELWKSHRDDWADWTRDLCVSSLAWMIRKVCKTAIEEEENQLFPGAPDHLPRAISVQPKSGANYYVALRRATLAEATAAVESLTHQIAADTRRRNALRDLVRACHARRARPGDRIVDVLTAAPVT